MIFNFISFPVFIVSLAIGLLFVYAIGPETKKVYIYPNPENIDKVLFKDKADNCFSFEAVEVECPTDESKIHSVPIQE